MTPQALCIIMVSILTVITLIMVGFIAACVCQRIKDREKLKRLIEITFNIVWMYCFICPMLLVFIFMLLQDM